MLTPKRTRFLLTPEKHREQAAAIREQGGSKELAAKLDRLATLIERRTIRDAGLFDNEFFGGRAPWAKR